MKTLIPVPFRLGQGTLELPFDANAVDVALGQEGPILLIEVNPVTLEVARKVSWHVHGMPVGEGLPVNDKAEYIGAVTVGGGPQGGPLTIAAYVEKNPILTPRAPIHEVRG